MDGWSRFFVHLTHIIISFDVSVANLQAKLVQGQNYVLPFDLSESIGREKRHPHHQPEQ